MICRHAGEADGEGGQMPAFGVINDSPRRAAGFAILSGDWAIAFPSYNDATEPGGTWTV